MLRCLLSFSLKNIFINFNLIEEGDSKEANFVNAVIGHSELLSLAHNKRVGELSSSS